MLSFAIIAQMAVKAQTAAVRPSLARKRRLESWLSLITITLLLILAAGFTLFILKFFTQRQAPPRNYFDYQMRIWRLALEKDPKNPVIYTNIGYLYLKADQPEQGLSYLKKALRLDPKFVPALYNVGVYYRKVGEINLAIRYLTLAGKLAVKENKYLAYYSLGEIYEKQGNSAKARASYEKSLADNPTIWNTHYRLGMLELKANNKAAALQHFEMAAQFNPSSEKLKQEIKKLKGEQ